MDTLLKPIDVILRAIREERSFRQDFSAIASTINDKIFSFYANPNCSCKSAIIDWVNNNINKTNEVITKNEAALALMQVDAQKAATLASNTQQAQLVAQTNKTTQPPMPQNIKSIVGKMVNIERTEAAYNALMAQIIADRGIYRGLTIVPNTVSGVEVWSVFFF